MMLVSVSWWSSHPTSLSGQCVDIDLDTNSGFSFSLHLFAFPPSHVCKRLPKLKNYSLNIFFILLLFSQHIGHKLYPTVFVISLLQGLIN